MTATPKTISFERMTGTLGASVHGVDLHELPGAESAEILRVALAEHGVLFFHTEAPIADEELQALGSLFGEGFAYPYRRDQRSPAPAVGSLDWEDSFAAKKGLATRWHTDGTPMASPPYAAMLTPAVLPRVGGDTVWASMTAAFDALSSHYQLMLEGMEALHTTANATRLKQLDGPDTSFGDGDSSVHPVVPIDPLTGRKFLYVNSNYTERIVGLSDSESTRLLRMLFDHVNTPEFHVRLRWKLGTVALWHERLTQHRAIADYTERRAMRRITLQGQPPSREGALAA